MNHKLPSTQAFWLGHLHHAFSLGQPLSLYAHEQGLCFAGLMAWRQRLMVQRIVVPDMHRPNRFVRQALPPELPRVEFDRYGKKLLLSIWDEEGAVIVYDADTLEEEKRIPMNKPSGKYNVWNKINYEEGTSH